MRNSEGCAILSPPCYASEHGDNFIGSELTLLVVNRGRWKASYITNSSSKFSIHEKFDFIGGGLSKNHLLQQFFIKIFDCDCRTLQLTRQNFVVYVIVFAIFCEVINSR